MGGTVAGQVCLAVPEMDCSLRPKGSERAVAVIAIVAVVLLLKRSLNGGDMERAAAMVVLCIASQLLAPKRQPSAETYQPALWTNSHESSYERDSEPVTSCIVHCPMIARVTVLTARL